MKKHFLLLISIFSFAALNTFAQEQRQTPLEAPKTISGGVVNGTATVLAKPEFPPAARAVRASGAVNVQITIDETGSVVSAAAVSGHPLLRAAAEQAALQSKFNPTKLGAQPVRVTGVLIYNFVAPDAAAGNWFKVGYELASVQNSMTAKFLNVEAIARNFPADWTAENEQLKKLAEIKQAAVDTSQPDAPVVLTENELAQSRTIKNEDGTLSKVILKQAAKPDDRSSGEQNAVAQSLIASLQGRLAASEYNLWQFNLGLSVSEAWTKVGVPRERARVISSLRRQIDDAPAETPADYLAAVRQAVELFEKTALTNDDRLQILQLMRRLSKN